ncbi:uncharacterized protein LOC131956169 [Physella acuta]|uniref:uncharacterized protein LOC131956169 n=1 Tax=Physella acuta TaxID=109671 RepID=UPI0027DC1359|nr:uncharacterized protein LOC131956169 [Physella acuta]
MYIYLLFYCSIAKISCVRFSSQLHELGDVVLTFLNHEDVQDELKQMISSSILLELTDNDVILKVKLNPDNQTVTFQDFVRSIVEKKKCFTIPNKDFENNPEWNDIRHRFDAAYSYRKLLIQEEKVVVLSLAQKIQDLDLIAKLLDFTCTAIAQKKS